MGNNILDLSRWFCIGQGTYAKGIPCSYFYRRER